MPLLFHAIAGTTASDDGVVLQAESDQQARETVAQFLGLELDDVTTLSANNRERAIRERDADASFFFFADTDANVAPIRALDEGVDVHLRVEDTGQWTPDVRKEAVFERGELTRSSTNRGGIGLYMVETVVTTYGGSVWIEDNDPSGAVVCLDLSRPRDTD